LEKLYNTAAATASTMDSVTLGNHKSELQSIILHLEENDKKLLEMQDKNKKESYFKEKYGDQVRKICTTTSMLLKSIEHASGAGKKTKVQSIPVVQKQASSLVGMFEYFISEYQACLKRAKTGSESIDELRIAKKSCQDVYMNYVQTYGHDALVGSFYALNEEYNKLASTSRSEKLPYILPKIDIPSFSGKYEEWKTFKDLFEQLIGSSLIPDAQKMCVLKTKLHGNAAATIASLAPSEANYRLAWSLLEKNSTTKEQC